MSIDRIIALYSGFHFESELRMLNRLADGVTKGVIVCIGSYRGQMDCAIALHAHVPVYCIDSREGSVGEEFPFGDIDRMYWMQNILDLGLAEKVRPINMLSHDVAQVWSDPVGMLFIDGSHDYYNVDQDIHDWLPHVINGGLVAFHDNDLPGVQSTMREYMSLYEQIERADLTTVYRVKQPVPMGAMGALDIDIDAELIAGLASKNKSKTTRRKAQ